MKDRDTKKKKEKKKRSIIAIFPSKWEAIKLIPRFPAYDESPTLIPTHLKLRICTGLYLNLRVSRRTMGPAETNRSATRTENRIEAETRRGRSCLGRDVKSRHSRKSDRSSIGP